MWNSDPCTDKTAPGLETEVTKVTSWGSLTSSWFLVHKTNRAKCLSAEHEHDAISSLCSWVRESFPTTFPPAVWELQPLLTFSNVTGTFRGAQRNSVTNRILLHFRWKAELLANTFHCLTQVTRLEIKMLGRNASSYILLFITEFTGEQTSH